MPLMQKLCSIAAHEKDRMRCAAFRSMANYLKRNGEMLDSHVLQRFVHVFFRTTTITTDQVLLCFF